MTEQQYRERRAELVRLCIAKCSGCFGDSACGWTDESERWAVVYEYQWTCSANETRKQIAALDAIYKEQTDATD